MKPSHQILSKKAKIDVINHYLTHGQDVLCTAKHFKMSANSVIAVIQNWKHDKVKGTLDCYLPDTVDEKKYDEIYEFAKEFGVTETLKAFELDYRNNRYNNDFSFGKKIVSVVNEKTNDGLDSSSLDIEQVNQYEKKKTIRKAYSLNQKLEAVKTAISLGLDIATKRHNVNYSTLRHWFDDYRKYGEIVFTDTPHKFSQERKKEIIEYQRKYGRDKAVKKFGCTSSAINKWEREEFWKMNSRNESYPRIKEIPIEIRPSQKEVVPATHNESVSILEKENEQLRKENAELKDKLLMLILKKIEI